MAFRAVSRRRRRGLRLLGGALCWLAILALPLVGAGAQALAARGFTAAARPALPARTALARDQVVRDPFVPEEDDAVPAGPRTGDLPVLPPNRGAIPGERFGTVAALARGRGAFALVISGRSHQVAGVGDATSLGTVRAIDARGVVFASGLRLELLAESR